MRLASLLAALALAWAGPALADSRGALLVVDADTFDVGGVRVRLHGVDAPEAGQSCRDPLGRSWPCGAWATDRARALWEGREALCVRVDLDRYGREVSRCAVEGEDLGAALVASGAALAYVAYSRDYVAEERAAEAAGEGVWRGSFEPPWDWRRTAREEAAQPDAAQPDASPAEAPDGCGVKGNVSDRGRIYHLPGGRDYARTRIDEEAGERWFCSAADAEAAGWRAPRS